MSSSLRGEFLHALRRKKPPPSSSRSKPKQPKTRPLGSAASAVPKLRVSPHKPSDRSKSPQDSIVSAVVGGPQSVTLNHDDSDYAPRQLIDSASTPQLGYAPDNSFAQKTPAETTLNLDETPDRMATTPPQYFSAGAMQKGSQALSTATPRDTEFELLHHANSLYPSPLRQTADRSTISRSAFTDALEFEAEGLRRRIRMMSLNESKLEEVMENERRRAGEVERQLKDLQHKFEDAKQRLEEERDQEIMKRTQLQQQLFRLFQEDDEARRQEMAQLREENRQLREDMRKLKCALLIEQLAEAPGQAPPILKHWRTPEHEPKLKLEPQEEQHQQQQELEPDEDAENTSATQWPSE